LWGVPFMVEGQGLSRSEASTILLASVVASVIASPVVGLVTSRYRATRIPLAISACTIMVIGWAAVLALFSGPIPIGLLVGLVLFTATGGPISAIGFAVARDYNGPAIVGTATGVVNVGGFVAGILGSLGIGWMLDAIGTVSDSAYRAAFAVAVGVQAVGLVQLVRWWLHARRAALHAQARGEEIPVPVIRHRWDLA
jgi:MFS family permease